MFTEIASNCACLDGGGGGGAEAILLVLVDDDDDDDDDVKRNFLHFDVDVSRMECFSETCSNIRGSGCRC